MARRFFLDVNAESVGASEVIDTTKIELRKRSGWWDVVVCEKANGEWMEVSHVEYTEKELRGMYHLLTMAKE
jgi:hypothetical protein